MPTKTAKKATKKVAKKVAKKVTKPQAAKLKAGEFMLSASFNGETFTCTTKELKKALQALAPQFIKTKVVIFVSNKFSTVERVMMIQKAKTMWRNEMAMDIFVKNILLGLKHE